MDAKAPPPNYTAPPPQQESYPPQQPYGGPTPQYPSPPVGPPPQQSGYFQGAIPPQGPVGGYTSAPQTGMNAAAGQQYQQQLFALCAQGQHDVTTKYGIAGIITAIACFPCGLIALFLDVEKRCVRCGQRVG